jgi:adenine phosphoribosyltransferase
MSSSDRIKKVADSIRSFPDFPKAGILFRDIFSLTKDPEVFADCISLLVEHVREYHADVEVIVGLDARGFIFGPMMSLQLGIPFVPIRKSGKLPGETYKAVYSLEYGKDSVEIQKDACSAGQKVIIVDDLLATGGTLKAAVELLQQLKVAVLECVVVIELADLKGRVVVPAPVFSLIKSAD